MLTGVNELGTHHYLGSKSENNGILYTKRGGFIDFGHLRDIIDWTAFLYNTEKKSQVEGQISLHLGFEAGVKSLVMKIPATEKEEDGAQREFTLLQESATPIQRHVKIKADANPHDPQWEQYFESRWGKKMLKSSRGRAKLYWVWLRQDGLCSTCQEPITKGTLWDVRQG